MNLLEKIQSREAVCAVIGLGYVGLPLAVEFAKAGFKTVGIDLDPEKVKAINEGESYIQDVSQSELREFSESGKLSATTDYSVLTEADTVSVCVPTPLRKSKAPDISYIVSAVSEIAKYLHKGQLIILESTTYPGTTEEIVLPILIRSFNPDNYTDICEAKVILKARQTIIEAQNNGYYHEVKDTALTLSDGNSKEPPKVGEDFFLAFSPERVDPGNPEYKTKDIPKVIGGITNKCTEAASALYQVLFPQLVKVSSAKTAEMVKLLENTFRSVNIALANEMSLMSESLDVDIWEVIDAAKTKPFGFMPFYPGPGLGGHCIPIDPLYLTWKARLNGFEPKFIELASQINEKMPKQVVLKVQEKLNEQGKSLRNAKILIVGVAYKKDVPDTRESPALEIIKILEEKGAIISYHDPFVLHLKEANLDRLSVELSQERLQGTDCVVIATGHTNVDYALIRNNALCIIDTRNVIKNYNL